MSPTLYVTIGAPASGKSMYFRSLNEMRMRKLVYVSSDSIRKRLYGDESIQGDSEKVFELVRVEVMDALLQGHDVYVDATHAKKEWRKYLFTIAQLIGDVKVHALYFPCSLWTLLKRDSSRMRRVGFRVLLRYWWGLEPPSYEEGFSVISKLPKIGLLKHTIPPK